MAKESDKPTDIQVTRPEITVSTAKKNTVTIEVKASFELDDAKIFDLNGKGLQIAVVAVN